MPATAFPKAPADDPILFQTFFKSVGPRTYAAQLKQSKNGNHYLVLTEGKRDKETDEVRKTRLFIFSEDFPAFFKMLHGTVNHIKSHPVPDEIKKKRERYWAKQSPEDKTAPDHPVAPNAATLATPATTNTAKPSPRPAARPKK